MQKAHVLLYGYPAETEVCNSLYCALERHSISAKAVLLYRVAFCTPVISAGCGLVEHGIFSWPCNAVEGIVTTNIVQYNFFDECCHMCRCCYFYDGQR